MTALQNLAAALGGVVSGKTVLCPGPGRSPEDRSLCVTPSATAADGFVVCSKAGDDPRRCRNFVKERLAIQTLISVRTQVETIDNGTITQDGVARVFAKRHADCLRYCHGVGAWYQWTGSHWQRDETALAFHFARELGREFTEKSSPGEVKEVRKVSFAGGVERFAKSDPALAVKPAHWDRDPYLLGTPGGTVDLRTGVLGPPDPADGITKITAVAPSAAAHCPRWLRFMEETFGGDAELIRFIQQWGGYCLTGDTKEHALLFGFGSGGNGKSVWLNVLTGIMKDYAVTAAMDTFTASQFDKHPTSIAMLRGARIVTVSETDEGRAWAEAKIKQMTGADPLTAHFMRQDDFTFKPQFKLTIIGNYKPVLKNIDDAQRRRFNLVPFNRKPAAPDHDLETKLMAEGAGILRWLIDGCLDWQTNGLIRPQIVTAATETYFDDQDLITHWLNEACDAEIGNQHKWEAVALLFASWNAYASKAGEKPGSIKAFSSELVKRGFDRCSKGAGNVRSFAGLRLKPQHHYGDAS